MIVPGNVSLTPYLVTVWDTQPHKSLWMQLKYTLTEADFLELQLFLAKESSAFRRSMQRNRWIIGAIFLVLFGLSAQVGNWSLASVYLVAALLVIIFFPFYLRWRYRRHYLGHIQEFYSERIGTPYEVELAPPVLVLRDAAAEGKVQLSELGNMFELPERFLIELPAGQYLNIPKSIIEDQKAFILAWQQVGVQNTPHLDWKW